MAKGVVRFFVANKEGMFAGIAYSTFSFIAFFAGLGYGAGCPEAGPEICDRPIAGLGHYSFYPALPHMASWGVFYYSSQQVLLVLYPPPPNDVSITGPAAILLPSFAFSAAFALWAFAGAGVQGLVRRRVPHRVAS